MKVSRNELIKQIYDRLVELEAAKDNPYILQEDFDKALKKLRMQLQDVMNSQCPIFNK